MPPTPPDDRPDPDALLAQVQQEEARARCGRLKIFFGASAGVGKTYAMLAAARAAQTQGVPLIVGLVETHGRAETDRVAQGLPRLALKEVFYRGRVLKEFDLDAALAFGVERVGGAQPPLVLLDELAHSNAAGSRHPKRWQDIEELLANGIDVWSTMNVQHLESLNDIVGGITGIRVWETVPDRIFDAADEVVVVDLPPDELLARLAAGKVYVPQQAERAAANFFRKGNLIALRELALRRTADRVDTQMQAWRRTRGGGMAQPVWATREAILTAVGTGDSDEKLVRRAARLAAQLEAPWHAVFVDVSGQRLSRPAREQALGALRLAQELGATTATLSAPDIAQALVRYAREHNLSRLVVGHTPRRWRWRATLAEQVGRLADELDVTQVALPRDEKDARRPPWRPTTDAASQSWMGYAAATALCALVGLVANLLLNVLELSNIVMLFLLAVVVVALRHGRGPAVLAALLGVALFDFFIVPPRFSFAVSDFQYLVTFGVMLIVALVVGQLTAGLKSQAEAATQREQRVRSLYDMSRALSAALMHEQVAEIGARFLQSEMGARSGLLIADDDNRLALQDGATVEADWAVAQWAYDQGQPAGRGTHTLPACPCLMLPLNAPMRRRGVLAVQADQRASLTPEQRQLLETCASLLAISLERIHYVQVVQASTVQIESERLRNSLLAAISHDLRTPLAAMVGLADTLELTGPPLSAAQAEIAEAIRVSALRMNALVHNLLDMARLESGAVQLRRAWLPLEEVVGSAIAASAASLAGRRIHTRLADDLPLLHLDAALFERVLANLLENAAKYTPPGSPIHISASQASGHLALTVEDEGPGLPPGREEAVFTKFERGGQESAAPGVGLGLAICRAIVEAHGGRISGENRAEAGQVRGARFTIRLPIGEPPQNDGSSAAVALEEPAMTDSV